jgi:hypothetical protein
MFGMLWIDVQYSWFHIQQLRTAIEDEWDNLPQATINSIDQLYVKENCHAA